MGNYQEYSDKDVGDTKKQSTINHIYTTPKRMTVKEISLSLPIWDAKYTDMVKDYCQKNMSQTQYDFCMTKVLGFVLAGGIVIEAKKEAIRDFGKAVNWFENNWKWRLDDHYEGFINPKHESQSIRFQTIRKIVIDRVPMLTIWPEDLKEIQK